MQFVDARVIESWARTKPIEQARWLLPKLVARLVASDKASAGVTRYRFLYGESSQLQGYDGIVSCQNGNVWIPNGDSVWEIGTSQDPFGKFLDDLSSRTSNPLGRVMSETSFVLVSPFRLPEEACNQWVARHVSWGWKAISICDAIDLEEWLMATSPSVRQWFGRQIGARPERGVIDIEDHWTAISCPGGYQLTPAAYLASRSSAVERCARWLDGAPEVLALDHCEASEAIDFFTAYCMSQKPRERQRLLANSTIVTDRDTWDELIRQSVSWRILVPRDRDVFPAASLDLAKRNGYFVLCPNGSLIRDPKQRVRLPRPRSSDLAMVLQTAGVPPAVASAVCFRGARSVGVVRARLSGFSESQSNPPRDAHVQAAVDAAVVLGGWDSRYPGDRNAIEKLARMDFEEFETAINAASLTHPGLFVRDGSRCRLSAIDVGWASTPRLSDHGMAVWSDLVESAFATKPLVERAHSSSDDYQEPIREDASPFSGTLRSQLAAVLAFLANAIEQDPETHVSRFRGHLRHALNTVFGRPTDMSGWEARASFLSLLSEAAPDHFLDALHQSIDQHAESMAEVIRRSAGGWPMASLIWALETASWSRDHFTRACALLLRIAELEKGGARKGALESLRGIFCSWYPQNILSTDEQLVVLDRLIADHPDCGWRLLISLVPRVGEVVSPVQQPLWRPWADSWQEGASPTQQRSFLAGLWDLLLRKCDGHASRSADILQRLSSFPASRKHELLAVMQKCADEDSDGQTRSRVCAALRDLTDEAILTTDERDYWEGRFTPTSLIDKHASLFTFFPPGWRLSELEFDDMQQLLSAMRADAVQDIVSTEGFGGIRNLIARVKSPALVGGALADRFGDSLLPACLSLAEPHDKLAWETFVSFVVGRFCDDGWSWCDTVLAATAQNPELQGRLLALCPLDQDAWLRAEQRGGSAASAYWTNCNPYQSSISSPESLRHATRLLLAHDRFDAATTLLWLAISKGHHVVPSSLLLECLTHASASHVNESDGLCDKSFVLNLIDRLREDHGVSMHTLAALELKFIDLFDRSIRERTRRVRSERVGEPNASRRSPTCPDALSEMLSTNPSEFVSLVRSAIGRKADTQGEEGDEADGAVCCVDASRASYAFDACAFNPHESSEGDVDEEALARWCHDVLQEASLYGVGDACAIQLGDWFSKAFGPPMGVRAPRAVEAVLDRHLSPALAFSADVARGFTRGLLRNDFSCGFVLGSDAAKRVADDLSTYASDLALRFPNLSKILRLESQRHASEALAIEEMESWREA